MKQPRPNPNSVRSVAPTFPALKRTLLHSGFRVVLRQGKTLSRLSQESASRLRARQYEQQTLGLILPEEGEIAINQEIPLPERVQTLLHELVHLYDDRLSERATERHAQRIYRTLNEEQLGWLEFMVS